MSHSPEPWTFGNDFADYGAIVDCGDDCEYIYGSTNLNRQFSKIPVDEQWANARRIVACVNACRGIPTEALAELAALAHAGMQATAIRRHHLGMETASVVSASQRLRQSFAKNIEEPPCSPDANS